jgi:hypothetical protein
MTGLGVRRQGRGGNAQDSRRKSFSAPTSGPSLLPIECRRLVKLLAGTILLAADGCSWFPLADYPAAAAPGVEEPAKVVDLTFLGTEN